MNRLTRAAVALFALALLAGPALAGKEKSTLKATVDPAYWDRKITKIGLLGFTWPHQDDVRMQETIPDLVKGALQDQGEFTLLFPDDVKKAAELGGNKEAYETLMRVWRTRNELDQPALATIQAALGLDAIAGTEVTHWEQHKLDPSEEGYSTTTVGMRTRMWDAHDRLLLWEATMVKVEKSPPYSPSTAVDAGGTTRSTGSVPEPPEYDVVTEEVVNQIIGSFPKEANKEQYMKAAAKKEKGSKKKEAGR
ncbi:MAG TPA: hypothetical protein VF720_07700 [Candidatus Eisenbacteria bacterium]